MKAVCWHYSDVCTVFQSKRSAWLLKAVLTTWACFQVFNGREERLAPQEDEQPSIKKPRKSLGRRVSFAPDAQLETTHLYKRVSLRFRYLSFAERSGNPQIGTLNNFDARTGAFPRPEHQSKYCKRPSPALSACKRGTKPRFVSTLVGSSREPRELLDGLNKRNRGPFRTSSCRYSAYPAQPYAR